MQSAKRQCTNTCHLCILKTLRLTIRTGLPPSLSLTDGSIGAFSHCVLRLPHTSVLYIYRSAIHLASKRSQRSECMHRFTEEYKQLQEGMER
jgi:hypothetical protein